MLFQAAATKIKVDATVVFATPSDGHTRLVIDNNTLRVIVTVGSKSETFDAVLTGIVAYSCNPGTIPNDVDDIITALKSGVQGKNLTRISSTQKML
ncbi:hypothetical protein [Spiroplasma endosymbiont of Virgichneumon dumeticola]|uniref:hypothetical protein n=1 Tax=Spiroplasma endosymbiont of Virgichneumon dumeticola TaxID=3139323 RepID=UPI0035C88B4E